jgi:DNA polymerase-3 subunit gamma/tau
MAEAKDQPAPKRSAKKEPVAVGGGSVLPASSESHAALARKYRPTVFAELIGQDAMVTTLRNGFATGRIAQAYMLTGVRGVGKTTTARLIARALNYVGPEGDRGPTLDMNVEGEHCRAILESRHLDVVEMDAASHTGIENIRDLIDSAHYKPNIARYKVYIIDEVHMLSKPAFAGLLKTLEEPPEHVKFIFATTEVRKVPVTVLSRCQRFDLKRIEVEALIDHLAHVVAQEGAAADRAGLALIARAAEGSVRDALSVLDRAIAFGSGRVEGGAVRGLLGLADRARIFDLLETVLKGDVSAALQLLASFNRDGAEAGQVLADLAEAVHAVTLVQVSGQEGADPAASEAEQARTLDLAGRLSMPVLARAWQMLLKGHDEVRSSPRPLAAADMVLVRLAYAADLPPPGELMRRLADGAEPGADAMDGHAPAQAPAPRKPVLTDAKGESAPPPRPKSAPAAQPLPVTELKSFDDVVALADAQRDLKLKRALLEEVRLVHFRPGNIELNPLPTAPRELTQELMKKLKAWTGRVWIVAVSDQPGAEPLGLQRRAREVREIETIREHPQVKEVLQHFPDARIAAVRPTTHVAEDEPNIDELDVERLKEDGANS